MKDTCFCESDKNGLPTLYERLCCCICIGKKEELIQLDCCKNYVHKSCFITAAFIHSNQIINSKDTPGTTKFSEIDICHYCQQPYNKNLFPDTPHTNEEVQLLNKNRKLRTKLTIMWTILTILSFGIGLCDNILLATYKNKGIELYKNKFMDNCIANYTGNCNEYVNRHECCSDVFDDQTKWPFGLTLLTSMIGAFLIFVFTSCFGCLHESSCSYDLINSIPIVTTELPPIHCRNHSFSLYSIEDYKEELNKNKGIYKSNQKRLIIPSIMLMWQLIYLFIMLGYNLWYIPVYTSPSVTLEESYKLSLYYIPILCLFNVFYLAIICPIISIIIVLFAWCFLCCAEERGKIKNNISDGKNNIELCDRDTTFNSLKNSSIV
uniref:Uncharacterized protein n=1 Tax=viral metagenome TaxID=1070528 RepID=A0A6C0E6J7_9ZZZZ